MHIKPLDELIKIISKLPGLGPRSAKRIALHMIKDPANNMLPLAKKLEEVSEMVVTCNQCFNIDTQSPCAICDDKRREQNTICVIENIGDLWAIEGSNTYRGSYHVLGGALSAIDGVTPDKLTIMPLIQRLESDDVQELIIATNPTLEGQTTAHYIANLAKDRNIAISRLANGIPIGAELDYLDEGTLSIAFKMRHNF